MNFSSYKCKGQTTKHHYVSICPRGNSTQCGRVATSLDCVANYLPCGTVYPSGSEQVVTSSGWERNCVVLVGLDGWRRKFRPHNSQGWSEKGSLHMAQTVEADNFLADMRVFKWSDENRWEVHLCTLNFNVQQLDENFTHLIIGHAWRVMHIQKHLPLVYQFM